MDLKKMTTQMMEVYRTLFEQGFAAAMSWQEQLERWSNLYWGQILAVPEEAKKGWTEWSKAYKKNCADVKKAMDEGFKNLEALLA